MTSLRICSSRTLLGMTLSQERPLRSTLIVLRMTHSVKKTSLTAALLKTTQSLGTAWILLTRTLVKKLKTVTKHSRAHMTIQICPDVDQMDECFI